MGGSSEAEVACIPWKKLTDAEHGSITQGILRADHTFRFMSAEGAKEASRQHRQSVAWHLERLGEAEPGVPRSQSDKVALALADFVAHLHDDLPWTEDAIQEERARGFEVLSESEFLRRAEIGRKMIDGYAATGSL